LATGDEPEVKLAADEKKNKTEGPEKDLLEQQVWGQRVGHGQIEDSEDEKRDGNDEATGHD